MYHFKITRAAPNAPRRMAANPFNSFRARFNNRNNGFSHCRPDVIDEKFASSRVAILQAWFRLGKGGCFGYHNRARNDQQRYKLDPHIPQPSAGPLS
ncbi:PREDICTED: uncharacterized protein LOC109472127 [Branchiostoma belcheri]|uniref:Uncharacterized protein LOC109472127 n=1 Tax=Branchiostoma belcheri TaxID=7741 RepID=A0A6P4YSC8_BRABE|nr:PREDICTED: uncharacterized protein LOC109472127 [Branchiostoma belcheri]